MPIYNLTLSHPYSSEKALDKIPERTRIAWALKIFAMGSLAWDYADTVIDCAIIMRNPDTKPLSRAVKEMRRRYDKYRQEFIDSSYEAREIQLGLDIEELVQPHFNKFHCDIQHELSKWPEMSETEQMFFLAIYQCLAVISALKLYAAKLDTYIGTQGMLALLPTHFKSLNNLIKEFAGDLYEDYQTVTHTAQILFNELDQLNFYDDEGDYEPTPKG